MSPQLAGLFRTLEVIGTIQEFAMGAVGLLVAWLLAGFYRPSLRNPKEERLLIALSGIPLVLSLIFVLAPDGYFPRNSTSYFIALGLQLYGIAYLGLAVTPRVWQLHTKVHAPTSPSTLTIEALVLALLCLWVLRIHTEQDLHVKPALLLAALLAVGFAIGLLLNEALGQVTSPSILPATSHANTMAGSAPAPGFFEEQGETQQSRIMPEEHQSAPEGRHTVSDKISVQLAEPSAAQLPAVPELPRTTPSRRMQLKLRRAQRAGLTGKVIFTLDARMEVPAEERQLIDKYRLGNLVIYDSTARQKHADATQGHLERTKDMPGYREGIESQLLGTGKMLYRFARAGVSAAMASLSLRVTVASLMQGVHVECKSMDELLGAENAIIEAGENLRTYIDTAESFDGREVVLEF